jgi:GAF domain-containing protein
LIESQVFGVLIAARRSAHGFSSGECEFLRQLGEHVALAAHQAQLYGALQQAYDDLRQSQQVVMQQERLRALGQMASGIAHDINNAISPVTLYTESLLETDG